MRSEGIRDQKNDLEDEEASFVVQGTLSKTLDLEGSTWRCRW